MKSEKRALLRVIEQSGGLRAFARLLGIRYQSIQQWERVPADRIVEVERVTGVDRTELRPDLYAR